MKNTSENKTCSVCGNSDIEIITVKEMRNGWREKHDYYFCRNCRFLGLITIPENMQRYYENGYYTSSKPYVPVSGLRSVFWYVRAKSYDTFLHPVWSKFAYNTILDWKHKLRLRFTDKILDYGCGNGDILFEFYKNGFRDLQGLDPYLPTIKSKLPLKLSKGSIHQFNSDERFNLIMMHHSFEHMPDQRRILEQLKSSLTRDGKLLIRMPLVNEAFNTYRENWVQIDAPRHTGIHSVTSFEILAKQCGYKITEVFYDSTEFQFIGSEQNKNDIAFFDENSIKTDAGKSIFSANDIVKYKAKALEYNRAGKGDQGGFILEIK